LWPNGGWIKMPLGTEVGLGLGHIVLHEDVAPTPPKRGREYSPPFGPCLFSPNGLPFQPLLSSRFCFLSTTQEIDLQDRLQNDLCFVEWNVKP